MEPTQVAVIGGGPGGYVAAFRAADLGLQVALIDQEPNPGGVCLYRGCIPSKALLHVARLLDEAREAAAWGVSFAAPQIDLERLNRWKNDVVARLTGGLGQLLKARKVRHIQGTARFADAHTLLVDTVSGGCETVRFEHAVLATGSRPVTLPILDRAGDRAMDSTGALRLERIPESLLVVGGGYIGLELGTVYASLGSRVSVVEMTDGLIPPADRDLIRPLQARLKTHLQEILLQTRVVDAQRADQGVAVSFQPASGEPFTRTYDQLLVAVGRRPNSENLGLETTAVQLDQRGFVLVDEQRRTREPSIFAIGDVIGSALAHTASHEAGVAAEVIAGRKRRFEPNAIPAVVFTDPEVAWCGLTEKEAAAQGRKVTVTRFPWAASGRATTLGRNEGLTKLILDPESQRVLGVGIVGLNAGELIAEGVLAVEMSAQASDLALTIHAHPTLAETYMEAAEAFLGHSPHLFTPKRR
jgi:dihydrolipoamide dehydrogenase